MTSPEEDDAILVSKSTEGITVITINRPHRRNAVDAPTALKLFSAFRSFEEDPAQKIAILTGAKNTFCAGFDLHTVTQNKSKPHYDKTSTIAPMGPSRLQLSKPLLCAISGYAVAGGLELSLLADLRVVEEDVVFGVFCRRWGVPLIDGGTVRLQRIIGLGRALDLVLTGRAISAQEALGMGLASRVVPKGKALDETMKLARELLEFPQLCMNLDRKSVYYAAFDAGSFEDAIGFEFEHGVEAVEAEGAKGAARFSQGSGRHGKFGGCKL